MEYVSLALVSITSIVIGWKLRNSKVDKNTILPGYTLEGVMYRRKLGGNILLVMGGILLMITLFIGVLMLTGNW